MSLSYDDDRYLAHNAGIRKGMCLPVSTQASSSDCTQEMARPRHFSDLLSPILRNRELPHEFRMSCNLVTDDASL